MKAFIFIFIVLGTSYVQAQSKGDNIILVKGVTFEQVVNTLLDSGYIIEKSDREFKTIKTEWKLLCSNCVPYLTYDIRIKDSTAIIKGTWKSDGGILGQALAGNKKNDFLYFDIQNIKGKVDKLIFNKMNDFAKSLKGEVSYTKQ